LIHILASTQAGEWFMLASDDPTSHLRAVSGNSQPQKGRGRNSAWKVAGDLPSSFRYAAQGLALLVLTVTAVLVLELLNTATEAVVDLAIGRKYHPLARIAKDCAAAAVLVAALASMLIAALLLVPPLLARLGL
jgi:diacylglycerol kinase (ATP)